MANVRCPMCSNLNPSEALLCAFCGARLKSAQSPSDLPVPNTPEEPQDDASDWLSSLRLGGESGVPAEKSSASEPETLPESEMPDWLSRIRERAKSETLESPEPGDAVDETPDWMKDLRGDADEPVLEETGGDWLDRLPGAALPASEPAGDKEPRIDDWLQSYPDQPSSKPAPEENEEWINKLSDWQSSSAETPRIGLPASEDKPVSGGFGLTGWLASLGDQVETPAPADEAPGWFAGEQEQLPSTAEKNLLSDRNGDGEQRTQPQSEEDLVSDWLRDVPPAPSQSPVSGEFPAWLGGEQTIQSQSEEDLVSGWLRDVPSAPLQPTVSGELPAWFGGEQTSQPQPEEEPVSCL